MPWLQGMGADEVTVGGVHPLTVGGRKVALYRLEADVFALADICTHQHTLLSDGYLDADCIECPLHQALFHIPTGECRSRPSYPALQTYPTRIQDGQVWIEMPDA